MKIIILCMVLIKLVPSQEFGTDSMGRLMFYNAMTGRQTPDFSMYQQLSPYQQPSQYQQQSQYPRFAAGGHTGSQFGAGGGGSPFGGILGLTLLNEAGVF